MYASKESFFIRTIVSDELDSRTRRGEDKQLQILKLPCMRLRFTAVDKASKLIIPLEYVWAMEDFVIK